MPQSFVSVLVHYIFGVKHREPLLTPDVQKRLYPFIGSVLNERNCKLLTIGGMPDHTHIFASMDAEWAPANLMRELKAVSSKWLRQTFPSLKEFHWQRGYGAFSVSISNEDRVRKYIETQESHHRKRTFREEIIAFLEGHRIKYDVRDIDE